MESAKSRFLRYVTYYTTSDEFTGTSPSTEWQKDLGRAAESAHRMTDRAVDALAHLAGDNRTASVIDIGSLVNCQQLDSGF